MDKLLPKIKLLLVIIFTTLSVQWGYSQAIFVENFDYASGTALLDNNWVIQGTTTTNPLTIGTDNLTFTGYPMNAGFSVPLATSGMDAFRGFDSQTTGSVYMAFLVKVTAAQTAGDYFISFKEVASGSNSYYDSRVFIKADAGDATKFYFGVSKNTSTVVYTTDQYSVNTTYLLVAKYTFVDGTKNDVASLYVLTAETSTEPGTPSLIASDNTTGTDASAIAGVLLRQGAAANAPTVIVDGIRVSTSWTDAVSDVTAPKATIVPADGATDVAIDVIPTITFDEPARNTDGSEITDANLTSLVKFKKGTSIGTDVPCTMTIDAAKKVITITPSASLENAQAYYIECGEVEDVYGNTGVVKSSTFTTIAAATPSITITAPVGGEIYYAGQAVTITWTSANITNVKVEAWVPSNDVYDWTTLAASVPAADGKLDFTIPADADYGTGYLVRVSDADNTTYNSTSGAFTVYGVATSLTDLKTRFVINDIVKLTSGVFVNFKPSAKNIYIQDSGAGILMYDSGSKITATYAIGDGITGITGKLATYNGMLEFVPVEDPGAASSTGNVITPTTLTAATLNSDHDTYESMLIKLDGVTFGTTGSFTSAQTISLTDGSGTTNLYVNAAVTDLIGTAIPNKADVIGVCMEYSPSTVTVEIVPRSLNDITAYSSAKAITAFAFNGLTPAVNGIIDETNKTIAATVPAGTSRSALVPTITVSANATVSPLSGVAADFTSPVTYTVTAQDGTTQAYTVTVSVASGIDTETEARVKVGPVPATFELKLINVEPVLQIEVYNVAGLKISSSKHDGETVITVPLNGYAPGVYFIRFTTAEGTFMKKFIKQ